MPADNEAAGLADAIELRAVSSDYFETLRIPIQRGRAFADSDRADAPLVVVLSQEASRKYVGGAGALGASIAIDGRVRTVVGIAQAVRLGGPETDFLPLAYEPLAQSSSVPAVDLVIRTHGDPFTVLPGVKSAVWSADPKLPIRSATTLGLLFGQLAAARQFNMLLVSLFGLVAVAIAATGIYGVVTLDVAERTHEIAVRMALGARRSQVVTEVLAHVTVVVGLGLAIGLVGAAALATLIKAFLFEVQPHNPLVYGLVASTSAVTGLLAAWLPARRAATVDPSRAMKHL